MVLAISALTAVIRVVPIEFQRRIVDDAIGTKDLDMLYLYCAGLLGSTLAALGLKHAMLSLQSVLGTNAMTTMRNDFFKHSLTLPLRFFHTSRPGSMVTMLVSEIGYVGDYLGTAWSLPLINILTLASIGVYLAWLNPLLAALSLGVYPLSMVMLPYVQRRVNKANRQRVQAGRSVGGKISDTFAGICDVQAHAGYGIEQRKFADVADSLRSIRLRWTLLKLLSKNLNNLFLSLSPLLVFLVGGGMTISGTLDIGELVAFLSAQALLYSPWSELSDHYQRWQDAKVRYQRVQDYFKPTPVQSDTATRPCLSPPVDIEFKGVTYTAENGRLLLDDINLTLRQGESVALVGPSGGGKSTLVRCLAGQEREYHGEILINDAPLRHMHNLDIARFAGLVSQVPYVFAGSLADNLFYPLQSLAETGGDEFVKPCIDDCIFALQRAGMYMDVLHFGLNTHPDDTLIANLGERILTIRDSLQLQDKEDLAEIITFFPPESEGIRPGVISTQHNLTENLICGRARYNDTAAKEAILQALVPRLLEHDLLETIFEVGMTHQVGTGGERLSGGQRQRLVLASVLLKHPAVLLLDEAGSALDTASRAKLQELFARLKGQCSILSVEHSLNALHHFDRILVMHHGRIVESGTYRQLTDSDTLFRDLVMKQLPGRTP